MLLDLHIVQVLSSVWPAYRDSLPSFQAAMANYVGAAKAEEWHTYLVDNPPTFRTITSPGSVKGFPVVAVELLGGAVTERFVGNLVPTSPGQSPELGFHWSESVEVTVMARRDEITRCLCLWIMAVLLRANKSFAQSGYHHLLCMAAAELSEADFLASEDLGVFIRRLSYEAQRDIITPQYLPGAEPTPKDWSIQLDLVVEDEARQPVSGAGVPGGVTDYST